MLEKSATLLEDEKYGNSGKHLKVVTGVALNGTHKKTKTKRIIFGNVAITMGESLHENLLKGKRFL